MMLLPFRNQLTLLLFSQCLYLLTEPCRYTCLYVYSVSNNQLPYPLQHARRQSNAWSLDVFLSSIWQSVCAYPSLALGLPSPCHRVVEELGKDPPFPCGSFRQPHYSKRWIKLIFTYCYSYNIIPVQVESLLSYCTTIPGESKCHIWHCDPGYQLCHLLLTLASSFVSSCPARGCSAADSKHGWLLAVDSETDVWKRSSWICSNTLKFEKVLKP